MVTHIYVCVWVYVGVCLCVRMCVGKRLRACVRIYVYRYISTQTPSNICSCKSSIWFILHPPSVPQN